MNASETPQITASQFPQVYAALGILPGRLGSILLNTELIKVSGFIPQDNLYFADPTEHPYTQGIVSESVPHVTLVSGLMRSGVEMKPHVDMVMGGNEEGLEPWVAEDPIISEVSFFPSSDPNESYVTLIAKLEVTPNLIEANRRLKLLPHCDLHPEFKPHITLAYVKDSSPYQGYIRTLNSMYQGKTIKVLDLNYGD